MVGMFGNKSTPHTLFQRQWQWKGKWLLLCGDYVPFATHWNNLLGLYKVYSGSVYNSKTTYISSSVTWYLEDCNFVKLKNLPIVVIGSISVYHPIWGFWKVLTWLQSLTNYDQTTAQSQIRFDHEKNENLFLLHLYLSMWIYIDLINRTELKSPIPLNRTTASQNILKNNLL